MKLIGYTCTYNNAYLVPYVMPYVTLLGYDKFIVYDNISDDNTVELLSKYPFVEIRKYDTGGVFNEDYRTKLHILSIHECMDIIDKNNGEDVWMTWTDFDEVIWPNILISFKPYLDALHSVWGYNYFSAKMVDLFFPDLKSHKPENKKQLIHCDDAIMGHWWMRDGNKPSLILVNEIDDFMVVDGNHMMFARAKNGKGLLNLNDTGNIHAFHLKYVDMPELFQMQEIWRSRNRPSTDDHDYETVFKNYLSASFPLTEYFLYKNNETTSTLGSGLSPLF